MNKQHRVALISGGASDQSSTSRLISQIGAALRAKLAESGVEARLEMVELRDAGKDIGIALATGSVSPELARMLDTVAEADAAVVGAPVYKAAPSGLLKSFLDVADDDIMLATPVVLSATAGTPRHALVPDEQMRPLFAYLRALPVPTSVFAATEDYANPSALNARVRRAAGELAIMLQLGVRDQMRAAGGTEYRRSFQTSTLREEGVEEELDFDSDLMRLAAGGV